MKPVRCAVVGAGHFGRYHAQKYAAMPGVDLVAIVDADAARAHAVAQEVGCPAQTDLGAVIGAIDAASVAVPTSAHHAVAARLLEAGIHVLIEKPIAATLAQADDLIALAARHARILQVGHLQRFLLRRMEIPDRVARPLYLEASRIAPFKPRGTDVGVVLDLMIHDIDLVLALTPAPVTSVDAIGAPVVTATEDMVNARLRFADGCVATLVASRVGAGTERRLRIYQRDSYLNVDLATRRLVELRRDASSGAPPAPGLPGVTRTERAYPEADDLGEQIADFVACVREGRPPLVGGTDGRRALETALRIIDSLRENLRAAGLA
jgi:predicted dehydrogenase